ncbi:MAG: phospholipase D-like domain-containing protein [Bacteroidales bacterium]|jgi:superfamily II DNA or RNA helicase|nr:phospholipase D-like domain-containing protein [Bacteroidales bacterium]
MSTTKFFNNNDGNTLFEKIKGICNDMTSLYEFCAATAYFRSSGYYKIDNELKSVSKIRILVGINIDYLLKKYKTPTNNKLNDAPIYEQAKVIYDKEYNNDIQEANYNKEVESGIKKLCKDIIDKRVELRIHPSKNLHAKFYLFLPQLHTENSDGWVIMGSSNLSDAGLGTNPSSRYELNVAMKDYDDVAFCKNEFENLWEQSIEITKDDIVKFNQHNHIYQKITPYELYIKLLIDFYGEQIEDDFNIELPNDIIDLKYQKDAVNQGYQMLLKHNGFILADVVGLGKTMIATMIAKRFIEANGRNSKILVIYPPTIEQNWKDTFKKFNITKYTDFISNGSLNKIIEEKGNYRNKEEYDLILVDEAHKFKNDTSGMYDSLQQICKAERENKGDRIHSKEKKVILISATPLNNRPDDLYNLLQLFQDRRNSNIDGIPNLQNYFAPKIKEYKDIIKSEHTKEDTKKIDKLYADVREKVIDQITVRRTRNNITNNPEYRKDLEIQNIKFPNIEQPIEINYELDDRLSSLFGETMRILTEDLQYSRYQAIGNLKDEIRKKHYPTAIHTSLLLANIYKTLMVKRLESSFYAFEKSLENLKNVTGGMIEMFNQDKIIIAPELNVGYLQSKGLDIDEIIELGTDKMNTEKSNFVFTSKDFEDGFYKALIEDVDILDKLIKQWKEIKIDPKLNKFIDCFNEQIIDKEKNPSQKLIIFTESKDTLSYLYDELTKKLKRKDILHVSSITKKQCAPIIQENFDANYDKTKQKNDFNILITTDVLAEGINLHRANVIMNYDTPWNSTKLIQRIGRLNRIGSTAKSIINYMFYPSSQGNKQIHLYKNALTKLQGFHSAFGEDSQIYSKEEIVQDFKLYNTQVADNVDKSLELLRFIRAFKSNYPNDYNRIKKLPLKSRTIRNIKNINKQGIIPQTTITYIASNEKKEFYKIEKDKIEAINFLEAIDIFKAEKTEESMNIDIPEEHYNQVSLAQKQFDEDTTQELINGSNTASSTKDSKTATALKILREIERYDDSLKEDCDRLSSYIDNGTYNNLTREINKLNKRNITIETKTNTIKGLASQYNSSIKKDKTKQGKKEQDYKAKIILAETFL